MFSQALLIDHLHSNYRKFSDSDLNELFFLLKDSSNKICQFTTDFLVWYDSQRKGFSLNREKVELSDLIKETTVLYENIALRKGLDFNWDIPAGLELISDRNILAIVIRNLVDNAVKYTRTGGIDISAYQKDGHIQIQVKDTGQGMTASKIAEITSLEEKDIDDRVQFWLPVYYGAGAKVKWRSGDPFSTGARHDGRGEL